MPSEPIPDFDLYRELEVHRDASVATIEAAFRSLAKRFHPDVSSPEDKTRITRLTIAMQWLGDPARRAQYDAVRDAQGPWTSRSANPPTSTVGEAIWADLEKHGPGPYRFAIGRTPAGELVVTDLVDSPHVLLTGDSWTDLGDWLRASLYALLYQATPAELKIVLIGLEWVDVEHYADVPHMLTTPVLKIRHAANALKWLAGTLEARQAEFVVAGVHDIAEYNRRRPPGSPRMPRILVVVGGVHDLLEVEDLDVERLLMTLALTADRAGINLVVACAPTDLAEVVGVIRAIPTRVGYTLTDPDDSESVFASDEAENLQDGELLYMPLETWDVELCRTLVVSDDDLDRVLDHWRAQGGPRYRPRPGEPPRTEWRPPGAASH